MIDSLNEVDIRDLLHSLEKEVGGELIARVMKDNPTVTIRHDVDWLHLHCCQDSHSSDFCDYYAEEELATCWQERSHKVWLESYFNLLRDLQLEPKTFGRLQTEVAHLLTYIAAACHRVSGLGNFMTALCFENPMALLPPSPRTILPPASASDGSGGQIMTALSSEP